jgi:predicted branched-subunit amino acid permease
MVTRLVRAGWVMGIVWAAISIAGALFDQPDPDDRAVILGVTAVAVVAAVAATVLLGRGRIRPGGAALVVAGLCAPTFGLAMLNFAPIVVGAILALRKEPTPAA